MKPLSEGACYVLLSGGQETARCMSAAVGRPGTESRIWGSEDRGSHGPQSHVGSARLRQDGLGSGGPTDKVLPYLTLMWPRLQVPP